MDTTQVPNAYQHPWKITSNIGKVGIQWLEIQNTYAVFLYIAI